MTDNEKIARWLGCIYVDQRIKQSFQDDGISGWRNWLHGEGISIAFDTDIALWHGENGVLAEIEKNEKIGSFLDALMVAHAWDVDGRWRHDFVWLIRCAEPAQLAAALVKMIDNG